MHFTDNARQMEEDICLETLSLWAAGQRSCPTWAWSCGSGQSDWANSSLQWVVYTHVSTEAPEVLGRRERRLEEVSFSTLVVSWEWTQLSAAVPLSVAFWRDHTWRWPVWSSPCFLTSVPQKFRKAEDTSKWAPEDQALCSKRRESWAKKQRWGGRRALPGHTFVVL